MQIERNELVELLRSRNNEETAQRAGVSLPRSIDLRRDRALLRGCGIDPNVLAALLPGPVPPRDSSNRSSDAGRVPEPPPTRHPHPARARLTLSAGEVDDAIDGLTRAFFAPVRDVPLRHRHQRAPLTAVVGYLMVAVGVVAVLLGAAIGGAAVIAVAVLVIGVAHVVRRRAGVRSDAELPHGTGRTSDGPAVRRRAG